MARARPRNRPSKFGFPGCVPTISANGAADGIVWILETSGMLHAYDASNLANEVYNSNQNKAGMRWARR